MYILCFQSYQSGLSQVKYRIIKYLGSLGGSLNYNLLTNAQDEITKQAISWDSQKHLKFDMPFMDMKPTIYLGEYPASMHKRKRYKVHLCLFWEYSTKYEKENGLFDYSMCFKYIQINLIWQQKICSHIILCVCCLSLLYGGRSDSLKVQKSEGPKVQ